MLDATPQELWWIQNLPRTGWISTEDWTLLA